MSDGAFFDCVNFSTPNLPKFDAYMDYVMQLKSYSNQDIHNK